MTPKMRARRRQAYKLRRLLRIWAVAVVVVLLGAACASGADTGVEASDTATAPVSDTLGESEVEHPLDVGCHSHDRGVTFHDLDGVVCEPSPQEAEDAKYDDMTVIDANDLLPAERGDPPPPLPHQGGEFFAPLPEITPGVQAWSDWCYFDARDEGVWVHAGTCIQRLSSAAWALNEWGADEACVLDQYTQYMYSYGGAVQGGAETGALEAGQRHGWHRCATFLDPDPDDGETQQQRCESLIERARAADPPLAHIDRYDGYDCADMVARVWPDSEDPARDQPCYATSALGWMWLEMAYGTDAEENEAKGTVFFC